MRFCKGFFWCLYSKFIDVIVCKLKRMFWKEDENVLFKWIYFISVFFYDIIKWNKNW